MLRLRIIPVLFPVLCSLFLFSSLSAQAVECPIQLKMGLLIAPDHIRVMSMGRTDVQINNNKQLFIRGDEVRLNKEQEQLLQELSLGLRKDLPEVVSITMDTVQLGFGALDSAIEGFAGSDAAKGINAHFEELKGSLLKRFARSGDNFYIAPQRLDELDNFFATELSEEVKALVTGSMKVMVAGMGEAYNRNESAVEGRRIDFSIRADLISEEIEKSLKLNANRLDKKSVELCRRFAILQDVESLLQKQLPELTNYDILSNQLEY